MQRPQEILIRSFKVVVLAAGCLFLQAARAEASSITWTPDDFNPSSDVLFTSSGATCTQTPLSITSPCSSLSFTFDLTAEGFVPGATSDDQITSAILMIYVQDDGAGDSANEAFKLTLEGSLLAGTYNAAATQTLTNGADLTVSVMTSLQADGVLNVLLTHQNGDFVFDKASFTATGTRADDTDTGPSGTVPVVPEPASMLLFGTGLAAVGVRLRRGRSR